MLDWDQQVWQAAQTTNDHPITNEELNNYDMRIYWLSSESVLTIYSTERKNKEVRRSIGLSGLGLGYDVAVIRLQYIVIWMSNKK